MLKPTCKCGQVMSFPKGKTSSYCPTQNCGMRWERRNDGYWAIGLFTICFTPFLEKEKVCSVKSRKDRYSNYPKSRRKRKAVPARCK